MKLTIENTAPKPEPRFPCWMQRKEENEIAYAHDERRGIIFHPRGHHSFCDGMNSRPWEKAGFTFIEGPFTLKVEP